jgi:L-alanine-DL-glutamate epimerase-like enolase superfamily enzyme
MMESAIGVGAAASLAAAYGTSATSDLDAAWWLAQPVNGGLRYEGSSLILPDRPGLGFGGIEDLQPS